MELNEIYAPVQNDLNKVAARLAAVSKVDFPHLSELLEYSLKSTGKKIRPALALISGTFYDYDENNLLSMAAAVEIMHIATLVHDDAIDKSDMRRGMPTVNAKWSEEKAILLGDYLFAEAGSLTASTNNLRAIRLFAKTLKTISHGEISQAYNSFNISQTFENYYQRITQKTAALFCMSTESGAAMSKAPEEAIQALITYGNSLGVAFQIMDDVLDYVGTEAELGKPAGADLTQGTITLPAILLMKKYPNDNPLKNLKTSADRQSIIKRVIDMVQNSTIIQECCRTAEDYCEEARRTIKRLPAGKGRQSLEYLAEYIITRRK